MNDLKNNNKNKLFHWMLKVVYLTEIVYFSYANIQICNHLKNNNRI